MKFEEDPRFTKEFKKLKKKYRSLENDLALFKKIVATQNTITGRHAAMLYESEQISIIKSRLFCRYLKGESLRIVIVFYKDDEQVIFIEVFYKGDKSREDKARVKEYQE